MRSSDLFSDDTGPAGEPAVDAAIEAELRVFEREEVRRLGLEAPPRQWRDRNTRVFTKAQRGRTTILFGGLTRTHDTLIASGVAALGYSAKALPCPDNQSLQYGKEFCNRGQCNPTYFTVGNLLRYLVHLRDKEGVSVADIISNYVFMTMGTCGPCRFGTYVTEYRKALRDAGFDGFRVVDIKQERGAEQLGRDFAVQLDARLCVTAAKCVIAGDVLNMMGYRIRPYEAVPGATDAAMERCLVILREAIGDRRSVLRALRLCRRELARVEVDWLRPKPKVVIIGEFWAMTTEGDGNYRLQRFLEQEGAEVEIPILSTWILYNIWCIEQDTRALMNLKLRGVEARHSESMSPQRLLLYLRLGRVVFEHCFYAFARAIGLRGYRLANMADRARISHRYYSTQLRGGEGHLEVGEVIASVRKDRANLVISVKPFGCMPSSGVSDGIQALVTARFPGANFLPVETTGDGAVNVYSRVQMALFKARMKAEHDYRAALDATGLSAKDAAARIATRPRFRSAVAYPAHFTAVTAANCIHELASS